MKGSRQLAKLRKLPALYYWPRTRVVGTRPVQEFLLLIFSIGSFHYAKTFGTRSLKDAESIKPISQDDIMWIASCTKLMTCIAVMQCVESGKLALDDDVSTILPEVKKMDILTGFDEETGKPTYTKAKNAITLR